MGDEGTSTREERLAAQLRANLKRRKAQARARSGGSEGGAAEEAGSGLPKREDGG
jgi:hypothetical protein